ncbi:MAG: hypothetical protein JHD15_19500 [Phenylobacterium sp.]|uniref:hypothetical protein n=1 Tax=Phenylobacterium sp. TaxID=1871053 RepID=UPI001A32BF94|nr:hypothetical protein [Phenylobacterium sp.]MBJ7412524.1 hypothetical protein [Phenylobacterium sp.]
MTSARHLRADRLAPYFDAQLRLAGRMAELTGTPLSDAVLQFTNLHRRLGFGVNVLGEVPAPGWLDYARTLEAAPDDPARLTVTLAAFVRGADEVLPLQGQRQFGCFACEAPTEDGAVRLHFNNQDTDEDGGPLATAKIARRRAELAALVGHVRAAHPEARCIRGKSWLYNLDAYRRLFPADYGASRTVAEGPLRLNGTSSWGQLIDAHERIRPEMRDALVASLEALDPAAPWLAFPLRVLATEAPVDSFAAEYGV